MNPLFIHSLYIATIMLLVGQTSCARIQQPCAIVNAPNGGRLGDQLITYAKIKWLAHKHNLKVLLQPFPYSDQFVFDAVEEKYTPERKSQFLNFVDLSHDWCEESMITHQDGTLYNVALPCKNRISKTPYTYSEALIFEPWTENDEQFLATLKRLLQPKNPIKTVTLPNNFITIAAHVRRGGGYESSDYMQKVCASKFPSDQYYIDQINFIAKIFNNKPLYVYIFTDDNDPIRLVKKYEQAVNNQNIIFDCRKEGNAHNKNVLEDLFSMAKFDCLIRPDSSLSIIAQLLGNHAIIIFPKEYTRSAIQKSYILSNEDLKQQLLI